VLTGERINVASTERHYCVTSVSTGQLHDRGNVQMWYFPRLVITVHDTPQLPTLVYYAVRIHLAIVWYYSSHWSGKQFSRYAFGAPSEGTVLECQTILLMRKKPFLLKICYTHLYSILTLLRVLHFSKCISFISEY